MQEFLTVVRIVLTSVSPSSLSPPSSPLSTPCSVSVPVSGFGRKDVVDHLLQTGANVHARDDGGLIPLHNACSFGHSEVRLDKESLWPISSCCCRRFASVVSYVTQLVSATNLTVTEGAAYKNRPDRQYSEVLLTVATITLLVFNVFNQHSYTLRLQVQRQAVFLSNSMKSTLYFYYYYIVLLPLSLLH